MSELSWNEIKTLPVTQYSGYMWKPSKISMVKFDNDGAHIAFHHQTATSSRFCLDDVWYHCNGNYSDHVPLLTYEDGGFTKKDVANYLLAKRADELLRLKAEVLRDGTWVQTDISTIGCTQVGVSMRLKMDGTESRVYAFGVRFNFETDCPYFGEKANYTYNLCD